jgi:CheY-like chemotaxis protein
VCPLETEGQAPPTPETEFRRAVGALAHDVNNLLTAILGYAKLVARTFDPLDPRRSDVEEIVRAAQQAGVVSHELLALSGRRAPSAVAVAAEEVAGVRRVLVVEDDRAVRYLVRSILSRAGYEVVEAQTAEDATARLAESGGAFHLLITDIVLPGGNGRELYDRALAKIPSIRVLYMSGYSTDDVLRDRLLDPNVPFIQKPFSSEDLSRKVREVLSR